MADPISSSDTAQAWLWVIEYCASVKEIDSETLHALIDAAPQFPKELGKKTMEVVALRCLEDLFSPSGKCMNEGSFAPEEKVSFDFSRTCEDVLHSILQEMSSSNLSKDGRELSKWDIQPFIMHKRASMPKCTLKQLKDAILEGTHPWIATLKELSGLFLDRPFFCDVVASGVDGPTVQNMASIENLFPVPQENDAAVGDDSHDRNKDHLSEDDTSSGDEECNHPRVDANDDEEDNPEGVDVLLKKNEFLSSQCLGDDDSSMFYWTEQNLCVRCKEGGQLLLCSIPVCPVIIHEKCLGYPAKFDEKGDFYCPLCAYSRATSKYVEAKKRALSTRKELVSVFRSAEIACKKKHHDPSCLTEKSVGKKEKSSRS